MGSQLSGEELLSRFREVRAAMRKGAEPLSAEDMLVQSMPDASPTKWHLAHTTWFYETFLLSDPALGDYQPYHPTFGYLFNSYYDAVGERHPRPKRGLLTRPSVKEVFEYRAHVEAEVARRLPGLSEGDVDRLRPVIELGINHEQQHLELLYTDIKHAFAQNPLRPAYRETPDEHSNPNLTLSPPSWIAFDAGVRCVGHAGVQFAFDNEGPSHRVFLEAFELASRPVSCGEYLKFMNEGGYDRPDLWLSDGWAAKNQHGWIAPLYWEQVGTEWEIFTLDGVRRVNNSEPVCHVSFYEADAYARWASARLPTEFEWEVASPDNASEGTLLEADRLHPGQLPVNSRLASMIGDVWEWTQSPYVPYPAYRPLAGALGEYNGKFMCNQMVLKGGSCVTPRSHIRPTYRNFFPPEARWQFTGLRLARST